MTGAAASHVMMASTQPAVGEANPADSMSAPRLSSALEGLTKIPWKQEGYLSWEYDGHKVNYVDEGEKTKVRPLFSGKKKQNSRSIGGIKLELHLSDRSLHSADELSACHVTVQFNLKERYSVVLRRVYHVGLFIVHV